MPNAKLIYLTDKEFEKFCEENPVIKKMVKNANTTIKLIKKELPKGKTIKKEVIKAYREKINKPIPHVSAQQIKNIELFRIFCDEEKINDKITEASDDNEVMQFIKETFPEEKDFSLETVSAYKLMLINPSTDLNTQIKNLKIEAFQDFCKKNNLDDKIKKSPNDNEAWELVKILPEGKIFSLETVTAYRLKLQGSSKTQIKFFQLDKLKNFCIEQKIVDKIREFSDDNEAWKLIKKELPKGKNVTIETVKEYREFLKESYKGSTQQIRTAVEITEKQLKEIDALKKLNKNLVDENDSLNNQNESLKQRLKVLNDQRGIKDDFTSKIPSLNDIASSEDKTSVFINKEILVKATKYVDSHCLVSLENVIINGYDLNSAIVQSVLLEFILDNSLL